MGQASNEEQMAKDVVTFLAWAAEPHLEARHKIGFKALLFMLIIITKSWFTLVKKREKRERSRKLKKL